MACLPVELPVITCYREYGNTGSLNLPTTNVQTSPAHGSWPGLHKILTYF